MPVSAVMICDFLEPQRVPLPGAILQPPSNLCPMPAWAANPNTENNLGFSLVDNSPFLVSIWYQTRPELQFGTAAEWQSQALGGPTSARPTSVNPSPGFL